MKKAKEVVKEFFSYIDEDIKIDFILKDESSFLVDVKMKEPKVLIGEKGQTLIEIERIVRILARKNLDDNFFINLDINDYKKRKSDYLISIVKDVADEVAFSGEEKQFPPMNSFERRVIHSALRERGDVISESTGEKEERRVVVKKKN